MTWRIYLLLAGLGLIVVFLTAAFQHTPGYMDADAYYAGGRQLARGGGFSEMFLWNYLDNPPGLPHPSNAYWMPMASLLAAAGAGLFGSGSWAATRAGFLVLASTLPLLTAALAWSFTGRRDLSITSGLLSVFPAFYLPFLPVTDTFGLYMFLGGLFFLLLFHLVPVVPRKSILIDSFFLGIISGFMHLSRADGLIWLLIAIFAILFVLPKPPRRRSLFTFSTILLTLAGYSLIMVPWFVRNIGIFGTPLAPGGTKMLWMTTYDQLFTFPATRLTMASWWHSGFSAIINARLWSLGLNIANTLAVQGEVFLLPLVVLGFWILRKDRRIQLAGTSWLLTLGVMTIVFPFAGARGGYFHSGAALQTVWWALAPVGLERMIEWGSHKRGWNASHARQIFQIGLIGLALLLTAVIFWSRVYGGKGVHAWDQESLAYSHIDDYLVSQGAAKSDVVMVANPPGFYLASGNPAIAIPDGDIESLLSAARKYGALYLVLEDGSVPVNLVQVYDDPRNQPDLIYLNEIEHARIFVIRHQ
jgi:hypothetical protein